MPMLAVIVPVVALGVIVPVRVVVPGLLSLVVGHCPWALRVSLR